MSLIKRRFIIGLWLVLMVAGLAFATPTARPDDNDQPLELPSPLCDKLQLPLGNRLAFHLYARGVQIYRWSGSAWQFVAPSATLFADSGYHAQLGIHYKGPIWESNTGSYVKAVKIQECSPDPNSIPWLLLQASSTNGPGVFSSVTFIHRVYTTGGNAPSYNGSTDGESIEIPYTAVYYFYRSED